MVGMSGYMEEWLALNTERMKRIRMLIPLLAVGIFTTYGHYYAYVSPNALRQYMVAVPLMFLMGDLRNGLPFTLWFFSFLCFSYSVKLSVLFLESAMTGESVYVLNYGERNILELGGIILIAAALIFLWRMISKNWLSARVMISKYWVFLLFVDGIYAFRMMYFLSIQNPDLAEDMLLLNGMTFGIWGLLQVLIWFMLLRQQWHDQKERIHLNYQMLNRNYELIQKRVQAQQRQVHDIRKEWMYILTMLDNGKYEECREYILQKLDMKDTTVRQWTGFPYLDLLLQDSEKRAQQKNISFEVAYDLTLIPMTPVDMCIVLGNLLDNALEAASKGEEEGSWIRLKLADKNDQSSISIANSCMEKPVEWNGRLLTNKEDPDQHGLGIETVRRIVGKYGGDLFWKYEEGEFKLYILFTRKKTEAES